MRKMSVMSPTSQKEPSYILVPTLTPSHKINESMLHLYPGLYTKIRDNSYAVHKQEVDDETMR